MDKPKVIVICGPTASGKTKLSIELAKKINGEIISADSMQIYKGMNIGTAKVTKEEMQGIKHYLIDIVSPDERYSVADFKKDAEKSIKEILKKNKVPIIVGGTGLYIDSIINGIEYNETNTNFQYREELEKIASREGLEKLYELAMKIDKEATNKISKNDKKRIFRILEIYKSTGKTKTELEIESRKKGTKYSFFVFGTNMDREKLYSKINLRVDKMLEEGLIEEVKEIFEKYKTFPTSMQGIGYKELKEYLDGICTKEEAIDKIKMETRRYAKRQITWFKRNKNIIWLDMQDSNMMQNHLNTILEVIR